MSLLNSSFAKNVVSGAVGFGVPSLIMLASFSILIHRVGIIGFGILQLAQAVGGGVSFADLGMTNGTTFYVAHHFARSEREKIGGVVGTSLFYMAGVALLIAAVVLFFAKDFAVWFKIVPADYDLATTVFRLAVAQVLLTPTQAISAAYFKGIQRFDIASGLATTLSLTTWGLASLVCLLFPVNLLTIAWIFVVGFAFSALLSAGFLIWSLGTFHVALRRVRPSMSMFADMWHYSAAVFSQGLLILANNQLQRMTIGAILGPAAVAIYATAINLTTKIQTGIAASFEAFFPVVVGSRDPQKLLSGYRLIQAVTIGLGAAVLIPLAIFSNIVCHAWLGPDIGGLVAPHVRVLSIATLFLVATIVPFFLINGMHRPWVNFWFMALSIAVTVAILVIYSAHLSVGIFIDAYSVAAIVLGIGSTLYPELVFFRRGKST